MKRKTIDPCPCDSKLPRGCCCGPLLAEQRAAATALQLMRSRYTAFAEQDSSYLLKSWHPQTRPDSLKFNPDQRWIGLKVLNSAAGTERDSDGSVEFIARYKIGGRGYRLHEISRFTRVNNTWRYLDGERGPKDSG